MNVSARSSHYRLSSAESWLLNSATQSRPEAEAAWARWRARCRVDSADARSQALFGMVYANVVSGPGDPDAALLKGIYRRIWYANQVMLGLLRSLLERLAERGAAAIVLNDAALVAGYYPEIGYRAIRSIDLLVPDAQHDTSIECVAGEGWQERPNESFASPTGLSMRSFLDHERHRLRVWTNLFAVEPRDDTEARLWQQCRIVQINGQPAVALGPVEQLLRVSAEASRAVRLPLFLCADAVLLVREFTSPADWTRLVWQAQRFEHILPLRSMLSLLQETLAAELPSWVLPALRRMAISHGELRQYHPACETLPLRFKSTCLRWLDALRPGTTRVR